MRRGCRERFPCHHGLAIPTCITARPWCTCCDYCQDRQLWSRWWEKMFPTFLVHVRGVTIRWATIRYISWYTTHNTVHDTIQNQLIYYQWKILKRCGMCHQYCYIKTVILARKSEFKINLYIIIHAPDIYFWPIVFVHRELKSHNGKTSK